MNPFKGRHFQRDIILWAVRWYCKYGISYRELQEMLAERGVNVDHSTIYRWVQRYAPEMEKRLRWYATIKGIEVMRALRKGQASAFYYGDPLGEMRLVSRVFEM
ncbi:IS6 family transposase [Salmonella enterica subsp. enterica serovar Newport]|uniref:IS6 family transposase n=1 Tax=Salmonella enterica subsp. enterica serovar Rissen TaxID=399587 RepID=A0A724QAV8_SALET|nr:MULTISPECIES: IS6 family transposase [Enterobacteriaceae]EAA6397845.1 IS6 family transposase [Salmonella enterica subsp. enterica serovar Newport]EAQ2497570.1 IS6 family transposase [Salmonella enterica]EBK1734019.1 IS6 family transposase [Salmonella enterica subsp. enterica serovar Heidelberg]ECD6580612.1 IS6 family transposase [Salmonella enterica subsp. enterica serovar Braenderup]EEB7894627.1 IS6 family transposase [Salmonella enterica subsp. enterica serovar Senftenberg]EHN4161917.1 I